jgi:uncharacterized SAM-binding protein YcdF (DUF218 family)
MSRRFKFLIILLSIFLAWILIAWALAENLVVEKKLLRADAILILGGSSVYKERTRKAAEIYRNGIATKIFLSDDGERGGWSKVEQRNPPFVELAQKELIAQGVAPENIEIVKPRGSGTIYEAEEFQKIIRENNLKSVLLVTSAYHTRRALWTFEKITAEDKTEIGIESPPTGEQTPPPFVWWLTPFGWNVVAGEYVKLAYYWIYY